MAELRNGHLGGSTYIENTLKEMKLTGRSRIPSGSAGRERVGPRLNKPAVLLLSMARMSPSASLQPPGALG